jgi:hypothetical protein
VTMYADLGRPLWMPIAVMYLLGFVTILRGIDTGTTPLIVIGGLLFAAATYFTARVVSAKRKDELNRRDKRDK